LRPEAERRAPIIERTCTFDAKIYKIVDSIFAVSPCVVWNKKIFKLLYFSFQLSSLLVEKFFEILPILTLKNMRINRGFRGLRGKNKKIANRQSKIINKNFVFRLFPPFLLFF